MADTNDVITGREAFVNDPRIACKYGAKCYQKNPVHQQKYKHPPPKRLIKNATPTQKNKKFKMDTEYNPESSANTKKNSEDVLNTKDDELDTEIVIKQSQERPNKNATTNQETKKFEMDTDDNSDISGDDTRNSDDVINTKDDQYEELGIEKEKKLSQDVLDVDPLPKQERSDFGRTAKNFNPKEFIKQKFLVEMPKDFYQFWDFCTNLKEKCPQDAFKDVGLTLVGPYDVLAGKFYDVEEQPDDNYLLHWRYYYDPPECQTVVRGEDKTGYHIGYYRDSPKDLPICLVSNCVKKDGILNIVGDNMFAAVYLYLDDLKKTGDPFKKMHIAKFQNAIKKKAEEYQLSLTEKTQKIRDRNKKIVTRTFSKMGIVVPYNRKTQVGYRDIAVTNKELIKLLTDIQDALPEQRLKLLSKLQDILTNVSIATDECDFGTGIELGLDILAHGVDCLNQTVARVLGTNYRLINREEFARIAEAHMKNRKKGTNLSIV